MGAITFVQTIGEAAAYQPGAVFPDRLPTTRLPLNEHAPSRFVWLVFDELDQQFIFDRRPPGLSLDEFDRFRSRALYATNAVSPAANTLESIPSLTTGKVVSHAFPVALDELALTLADGSQTVWSKAPDVFTEARSSGLNPALAGWYHPYCRVLGRTLTACFSSLEVQWGSARLWSEYATSLGFWQTLPVEADREFSVAHAFRRFDGQNYSGFDERLAALLRAAHLRGFLEVRQKAIQFLQDPELTFVFVHIPVPHSPGIYDRRTGAFSLDEGTDYMDNLVLADRFLGEVRRALELSGSWDDATIVISADHPFRKNLWSKQVFWTAEMANQTAGHEFPTIPFLLKLPRQQTSVRYAPQFNTVVTRDLLLALMRAEVRSPKDVCRWLDRHRLNQ